VVAEFGLDAVAAVAANAPTATAPTAGEATPEDIAAAAVLAATAALPEPAIAADVPQGDGVAVGTATAEATDDHQKKQGVTFAATLALTETADDAAAQAEGQLNAATTENERQLEDAGSSFRRNASGQRRNPGNGTGTTGNTPAHAQQPATTPATPTTEVQATTSANPLASPTSGVAPLGFDTGLGNSAGLPGWNLHLAQGNALRRGDFVANLRQQLQNLPVHEQVALSIQRSLRDGGGSITLQLSPSELGRIHLKLSIDEEKNAQASVMVERPATLELLQRDMKALERALQDAGLKAGPGDLSFSLQGGDPESFAREFGSGNGNGGSGSGLSNGGDGADELPAAGPVAVVDTADGWVDVQV
jgi:flagellar hook-length control protein FliK